MRLPIAILVLFSWHAQPAAASGTPVVVFSLGGALLLLALGFVGLFVTTAAKVKKGLAFLILVLGSVALEFIANISDYDEYRTVIDIAMVSVALFTTALSVWIQVRD